MLSSCKLKEEEKKKKKGFRPGELERMEYRYVVVCGCVCMCVLKNRETVFGLVFFFSFLSPSLLGAQCQAGHGPCRLSSHCALRFQSSPRLIPGARRGISPRRSPGRCPSFSRRSGMRAGDAGMAPGGCPRLRPPLRVRGPLPGA